MVRQGPPTPLGLRNVTLVMPGTCFKPSLPMAFRAFFSLRLWTATLEPAGMVASPSLPASTSESEELDASSSAVAPFLVVSGASSSISSILGFAILNGEGALCCVALSVTYFKDTQRAEQFNYGELNRRATGLKAVKGNKMIRYSMTICQGMLLTCLIPQSF